MEPKIHKLAQKEAIDGIFETMEYAGPGDAPFALVLGSGFSYGLVPTAKQLVEESLPLWLRSRKDRSQTYAELLQLPTGEKRNIAAEFWKRFVALNRGCNLRLNPSSGLPEDSSAAYMAAFEPQIYLGAVGEPALARKFQRDLMQLERPRLNPAHFFLASILGAQNGRRGGVNTFV